MMEKTIVYSERITLVSRSIPIEIKKIAAKMSRNGMMLLTASMLKSDSPMMRPAMNAPRE